MEHRHGTRLALDCPVRVSCPNAFGVGRLRNVSLTGAYLQTEAILPPLASVRVEIELPSRPAADRIKRLTAYIVRMDTGGYGLEWHDFERSDLAEILRFARRPQASHGHSQLRHPSKKAGA